MRQNKLWIDTRLNQEEMDFLNQSIISEEQRNNNEDWKENADGNVSRCDLIDKDNWFYETVLKKLTERMFYRNCNNYYEEYIENETPPPEFKLTSLWVNYQKKHDHIPIHNHDGLYSFVVFMKIPTDWEEQHATQINARKLKSHMDNSTASASDFMFLLAQGQLVESINFPLSPDDKGRMLFFSALLQHQVYPFYDCEEERITISGNISLEDSNRPTQEPEVGKLSVGEKEKMLKILENSVRVTKEELRQMKKELSI